MPANLVYCQYEDCRVGYPLQSGIVPRVCPGCERPGRWSTKVPIRPASRPLRPYVLSAVDRIILRCLGIKADE